MRGTAGSRARGPGLRACERPPGGDVPLLRFRGDVLDVGAVANELLEVVVECHGDRGSFRTSLSPAVSRNPLQDNHLVGATGFEPATPCAQGRCATRLRYAPTFRRKHAKLPAASAGGRGSLTIVGHRPGKRNLLGSRLSPTQKPSRSSASLTVPRDGAACLEPAGTRPTPQPLHREQDQPHQHQRTKNRNVCRVARSGKNVSKA